MAGNWEANSLPVLPGLYMNFQAAAVATITGGDRGTAFIPVAAHWGPVNKVAEVATEADIVALYTRDVSKGATAATVLRLALLGKPKKIKSYRIASRTAAPAATILFTAEGREHPADPTPTVSLECVYSGERGNAFAVTVRANILDATYQDIVLYEGASILHTFTFLKASIDECVKTINADTSNVWIRAVKLSEGPLADVTQKPLTGGNSGISDLTVQDYVEAFDVWSREQFNVITLGGMTDPGLQTSFAAWVTQCRDQNGAKFFGLIGGSQTDDTASDAVHRAVARSTKANYEGLINVGAGVVLDGVKYSSAETASYVAGLICGQKMSESTTYATTPFEDVTRRWSTSEKQLAVKKGVFLLFKPGDLDPVRVLKGINTLSVYRQGQNYSFTKIKIMRLLDAINNDMVAAADKSMIGKLINNDEGRQALIGACVEYLRTLAQDSLIENRDYKVYLDPAYHGDGATIKPLADQAFLKWEAIPVDCMEQIFSTFIVK